MPSVTLPSGCTGLDLQDGTRYDAPRQGTAIEVSSKHARALKRGWYGQTGTITGTGWCLGTKKGRWCMPCRRLWNAWSASCPRCGQQTQASQERETS